MSDQNGQHPNPPPMPLDANQVRICSRCYAMLPEKASQGHADWHAMLTAAVNNAGSPFGGLPIVGGQEL